MEKTIHNLQLHKSVVIDNYTRVVRVPGGWIYIYENEAFNQINGDTEFAVSQCFVPFDNEFQEKHKSK